MINVSCGTVLRGRLPEAKQKSQLLNYFENLLKDLLKVFKIKDKSGFFFAVLPNPVI